MTPSKIRTRSAGWLEPQGKSWNRGDGPDTEPRRKARGRDSQENRWALRFGRKAESETERRNPGTPTWQTEEASQAGSAGEDLVANRACRKASLGRSGILSPATLVPAFFSAARLAGTQRRDGWNREGRTQSFRRQARQIRVRMFG